MSLLYGLASHVKSRVIVDLSTEMLEIPMEVDKKHLGLGEDKTE